MIKRTKFLFLEPFYGGSHKDFADGLVEHSRHRIELYTMPDKFWKWRLRSAAIWFSQRLNPIDYAGVITTSMLRVADLKALWGRYCPPILLYNHESQVSYPIPQGHKMEYEFAMVDLSNGLSANRILFNSHSHCNAFFTELPQVLKRFPEYAPEGLESIFREKSAVLYPGCRFFGGVEKVRPLERSQAPLVIWNHRWEFDKQPKLFFQALDFALNNEIPFRLAILGETRQARPKDFESAQKRYAGKILRYGYVDSKSEYLNWLRRGAVVVSTSIQENFGIATVEAIRCGCVPILPYRLSYPEILSKKFHQCLYHDFDELVTALAQLLISPPTNEFRQRLADSMAHFSWEHVIDEYDRELDRLVNR